MCVYTISSMATICESKKPMKLELPKVFTATELMRWPQFGKTAPNNNAL